MIFDLTQKMQKYEKELKEILTNTSRIYANIIKSLHQIQRSEDLLNV